MKYEKDHEEPATLLEYHKGLAMAYCALVEVLVKSKVIPLETIIKQLDKYISLFEEDPLPYGDIIFSIKAVKRMLQMPPFPEDELSSESSRAWLAVFSGVA